MVRVVDVAGIEEGSGAGGQGSVEEEIARQMRGQAMREVEGADLLVLVEEWSGDGDRLGVTRAPDLVVRTKGDLDPKGSALAQKNVYPTVAVSAVTGDGMEPLRAKLDELAFGVGGGGAGLALNARHVAAIEQAREALTRAAAMVEAGSEVVAMELRETLEALGGVLGRMSPDDLLGKIFSEFCIGK
jgi:tRNA modification GTPase